MIDKKRYELTGINPSSGAIIREFENFDFVISYNSDNQCIQVYIRIGGNKRIHIEYIDLFEGDIVYPHVKEGYDIVLSKCQKKYFKINNMSLPCLVVNVHGVCDQLLCWIYLPQTMENPIVSISHIEAKPVNVSVGYECELTESVIYENTVRIALKKKNNEKFNFGTERDYIVYLSGIEFSSESL